MEEMVDSLFRSSSWESGISEAHKFVTVSGDISVLGKDVFAQLQFLIDKKNNTFDFNALEFNGKPQNTLVAFTMLDNMCKKSIKNKQLTDIETEEKVIVPNIVNNCDADIKERLEDLGLKEKMIYVSGPDDKDAGAMGCPYHQIPEAGSQVKRGTVVSYRVWGESG
jgi:hypothetical protein